MSPCILFSGLNVLGFGCLSAEGDNIIPSLSPSITSLAVIASVFMHGRTGYGSASLTWEDIFVDRDLHVDDDMEKVEYICTPLGDGSNGNIIKHNCAACFAYYIKTCKNSVGSPFSIIRELLVVLFYALEIGQQLLLVNLVAILLNALLDWLSVTTLGLGAQGLPYLSATSLLYPLMLTTLRELVAIVLAGILGLCSFYIPLEVLRFPALKRLKQLLWRLTKR
ncbi:hypothetical protein Taro_023941 [Colocasia esculenta]|uniref:Uncharacterized protein n=1 Tax=Colocasia esculenta TaxID=4460 RepID=A0A843UYV3_COLES|nr:hypothetical protein [Colocasia esculenta]